ncbi:hypothetical protein H1C71_009221 [Ictidomys tridecemlineatus]|nr:hypothetical protein H1C71_009221 [Ictidomys tridecemlineatus]
MYFYHLLTAWGQWGAEISWWLLPTHPTHQSLIYPPINSPCLGIENHLPYSSQMDEMASPAPYMGEISRTERSKCLLSTAQYNGDWPENWLCFSEEESGSVSSEHPIGPILRTLTPLHPHFCHPMYHWGHLWTFSSYSYHEGKCLQSQVLARTLVLALPYQIGDPWCVISPLSFTVAQLYSCLIH